MSACEVVCCRSRLDPNRTYHKFPTDTQRSKEWMEKIGKKSKDLKSKSVICSRHFRFKDYYPGGKRLLPSAVPVLRLSSSPKKELVASQMKKHESNTEKNSSLKNLVFKTTLKVKDIKHSPKLLKTTSKSNITSSKLSNKILGKKIGFKLARSDNQSKQNLLMSKVTNNIDGKHNKMNKGLCNSLPMLRERSHLNINNNTLSQKKYRLVCKNEMKPLLQTNEERKHKSSSQTNEKRKHTVNFNAKKGNSVSGVKKCSPNLNIQGLKQQTLKLENPVKSKNIVSKSSYTSACDSKPCLPERLKTTKEQCLRTSEIDSRSRRIIRKRKRLVSDDESESTECRPKVQKPIFKNPKVVNNGSTKTADHKTTLHKKCETNATGLGALKKKVDYCETGICNSAKKNLSEIEKMMFEMQNKIQLLEKKAILDEMKIDAFKKTLIIQRNTNLDMLMNKMDDELLLRMDLLYYGHDPQRICRLCLQLVDKKEDLIPLFWPMKNKALLLLIEKATNVEVKQEDGMPSNICSECLKDIKRVDWFQRRTQKSNSLINKYLVMKKSSVLYDKVPRDVKPKLYNAVDPSTVSSMIESSSDNLEETTDEFKIENVFSLSTSPISAFEDITMKQEQESDNEKELAHELNTTYSISLKKPLRLWCEICTRTFKNPRVLLIHSKYCSKRFQCSECNKCFLNVELFRKHKQKRYACFCAENLRYCFDCNLSFRWKWQLVFHVLRHNTQACVLCNNTIHSKEHLLRHLNEDHLDHLEMFG